MTTPQTPPGPPSPASRLQTLLWVGLGMVAVGMLIQLAFSFVLANSSFDIYRAIGWLNFLTILTPIGTVLAVIGGAGVGTRMALREAGLLGTPGTPPAGPYGNQPGGPGGHPGQGPYPSA